MYTLKVGDSVEYEGRAYTVVAFDHDGDEPAVVVEIGDGDYITLPAGSVELEKVKQ